CTGRFYTRHRRCTRRQHWRISVRPSHARAHSLHCAPPASGRGRTCSCLPTHTPSHSSLPAAATAPPSSDPQGVRAGASPASSAASDVDNASATLRHPHHHHHHHHTPNLTAAASSPSPSPAPGTAAAIAGAGGGAGGASCVCIPDRLVPSLRRVLKERSRAREREEAGDGEEQWRGGGWAGGCDGRGGGAGDGGERRGPHEGRLGAALLLAQQRLQPWLPPIMMAHAAPLHPSQWPAFRDMKAQMTSNFRLDMSTWVQNGDCNTFDGVSCDGAGFVTLLSLSYSHLTGSLPETIGVFSRLQYFYIDQNSISGSLPASFSNLVSLREFDAHSNQLSGPLPEGIGTLTALYELYLQDNQLDGPIPSSFTGLTALTLCELSNNQITGSLPEGLGAVTKLIALRAYNNLISGPLPASITAMTRLYYIELQNNSLSGHIPSNIGSTTSLNVLNLRDNQLSGTIPSTIGNLFQLYSLDISNNQISGTIPDDITGLVYLTLLDMSSNSLTGTIPQKLSGLTNLQVLNLRDNQLTGKVVEPVPPAVRVYKLDHNYLTQGFSSPPPCGQGYITFSSNCAAAPAQGLACVDETQRAEEVCSAFCGVSPTDLPCNGHGVCFLDGPSNTPTCLCDDNYVIGEFPGSCVVVAGGKTEQQQTPTAATLTATGDASVDAATATLTLTPAQPSKAGSVFLAARVPLFSYQLIGDSCGRQLAFSSSFSFTLTRSAAAGSEGFACVVAFDATPPTTPVAGGMGYAGMGARSVAVEFDTSMDAGNSDPDSNHVGINTGGSVTSVITAKPSTPLNDGKPKHVWIKYDPSSSGSLRIFLSSQASPRPTTPLLSARISLSWTLSTYFPVQPTPEAARGFKFSEAVLSQSGMNRFFSYASSGSAAAKGGRDVYGVRPAWSWARPEFTWPVKTQSTCGDCWGYAVVGSVEAAYGILGNAAAAPVLSVEQLKAAMKVGCSGSTPSQAFQLLLKLSSKGGGLVLESQGPAVKGKAPVKAGSSSSPFCSPPLKSLAKLFGVACGKGSDNTHLPGGFPISGFESTSFYGWFGLLLAVQRQPVVVHIEASAETFKTYDGVRRAVCCLGPRGNEGVWGGGGVCGINSLPGLYPVVRVSSDPCYTATRTDTFGSLFNPCGKFTCIVKGKTNESATCQRSHKLNCTPATMCSNPSPSHPSPPVLHPLLPTPPCDSPEDACKAAKRNPCAVGTCVNDGAGSYSCVCPPGFRQGTTVDGTFSCALGDTRSQYTVMAPNLFCLDVYPPFGLSLQTFRQLNPELDCSSPLRIGTVLSVIPNSQLVPCSVFYTTAEGDTCQSIGEYFSLNNCPHGDPACASAFQALNPGLSCSLNSGQLQPNQAVCVERRATSAAEQVIPVCSQYYLVQSGETCDSIRNVPRPALSRLDFFRFNPGIKCNRLVPDTTLDLHTGFEACIQVSSQYTIGICPRSTAYVAGADDRCSSIQIRFFKGNRGCYKRINGYECLDKVSTGSRICLLDQTRIRQGVCTV
ncbi:unnamed protein product, partial [Closterium sp. Yama58-4]